MGYAHLFKSLRKVTVPYLRNLNLSQRCYSLLASTNEAKIQVGIENLTVGQECEGFKVESIQEVDYLALTAVRLSHNKTGADYLHVSREDANNVFCVAFRTTPQDSTGVSHILEHTVLCGSQKYPCRDPFFRMLNRSLSTFMNAMTGADYTMYPFSSQNSTDFKNLMSVYMDSVFHPHLRELDFLQEGWRLEHQDPENPETPLALKGVVFNEMKGAFADSGYLLYTYIMNNLLPSHTYSHMSGGYPPKILDLTWEQLKNFHSTHYHPSNSRFYTYGNLPLKDHLKFINENYLANFSRISASEQVPSETRWSQPRRIDVPCRQDPFAPEPEKQTSAVVSYLLSDISDLYENFVLQIIGELLIGGPNSPFYRNLLEPNIGMGYSPVTGFDHHTKDTTFSIGLQGIHNDDVDKVLGLIQSTLEQVVEEGFTSERIEAVLHSIELSVKHQTSSFGLSMIMGVTPLWNHGGNPIEALQINAKVEQFRQQLSANPDYLVDQIRRYLVDNQHRLVTVMSPDDQFEAKLEAEEKEILDGKCAALSSEQRQSILSKGRQLLAMQSSVDDVECLPTLQISDIDAGVKRVHLEQLGVNGVPLQLSAQPTNGITYFRAAINASHLDDELKRYLPLFCMAATKMGAGQMDYRQLDQAIELKTGGLSVGLHLTEAPGSVTSYEQSILLSSHCLDRNSADMFHLWHSIFNQLRLEDTNRLETLLRSLVGDLSNNLTQSGHQYAMTHAASCLTPTAQLNEMNGGISFIKRVKELTESQQYAPVLDALRRIADALLAKENMRCALNSTPAAKDGAVDQLDRFLQQLHGSPVDQPMCWSHASGFRAATQRTHNVLPVPVNFTSMVVPGVPYLSPDYAPLRVLGNVMTAKFLHPEVREKGGAYGGGASASASGLFSFYSYRDPRSVETVQTFERSIEWALRGDYDDETVKEAKLRVFQRMDGPVSPSAQGMRLFLSHVSDDQLAAHRQQLIGVTKDDLLRVTQHYLQNPEAVGVTVIGPSNDVLAQDPSWLTLST